MKTDKQQKMFATGALWDSDRVARALASARRAWVVAGVSAAIATASVLAICVLTPLKTIQTNLIVMDKSTGHIEPLVSPAEIRENVDDIFTRKFVSDFMLARENYTFDTAEINYYTAAAYMSPQLQAQWGQFYNPNNPESPLAIYKNDTKVTINILSITIHTKDSGMKNVSTVRFEKKITKGDITTRSNYIATITYKYVMEPKEEKLLRINPVGFMVTDYRVDAEIGGMK